MRTTLEIPDKLFRQAKIEAASRGIPLKTLVERGLTLALRADSPCEPERKRVKLPLFGSKKLGKLKVPDDIAYRSQLAEDKERYAASLRR